MKILLLFVVLLFIGCDIYKYEIVYDQKLRDEIFNGCLDKSPKVQDGKSSHWLNVIDKCKEVASYHSKMRVPKDSMGFFY